LRGRSPAQLRLALPALDLHHAAGLGIDNPDLAGRRSRAHQHRRDRRRGADQGNGVQGSRM
jgi:hypothetical protein